MQVSTSGMPTEALYKLLTGSIVPRPIAWVTTVSLAGVVNAAPFSAYTWVSNQPPLLLISVGRVDRQKDTLRNIIDTGCFVVNMARRAQLEQMNATSAAYPSGTSETAILGIDTLPSSKVAAPRIATSPVSMECRLDRIIEFGMEGSQAIIGQVLMWHIDDELYSNGKIDQQHLGPIGRIGGGVYAEIRNLVPMETPYLPQGWRVS